MTKLDKQISSPWLSLLGMIFLLTSFPNLISGKELISPLCKLVENSPGTKPGSVLSCSRILVNGVSRVRNLDLFFHSLKLKVELGSAYLGSRMIVEVCLHGNSSLDLGMCRSNQWQKLSKGSWVNSISPFCDKIVDVRMSTSLPCSAVVVSTEEEFLVHRVVLLVVGVMLMVIARLLSESIVFYYGGAMAVGVILVFLMVLFQGMKLLPTGRKSSVAIFLYSSVVGVATFLLHYLSGLLQSALTELGISEEVHRPLGIFLLLCLFLAGAWLGFWGVRKLVLDESGSIDQDVAYFVEWSMLIFATAMILQSSIDTLLATEALLVAILIKVILRSRKKLKLLRRLCRRVLGLLSHTLFKIPPFRFTPADGLAARTPRKPSPLPARTALGAKSYENESYYSTFHRTPERRKFSKEEWKAFTEDSTRNAMEELSSSPDFARWVASNAERITLQPAANKNDGKERRRFHWLFRS